MRAEVANRVIIRDMLGMVGFSFAIAFGLFLAMRIKGVSQKGANARP